MDLEVEISDHSGVAVVAIAGELEFITSMQLRTELANLAAAGYQQVVVELDRIVFLDSTGLGVLVGALKRLRGQDGDLLLACTQRRLLKRLAVTGLARVFAIHPSSAEALASLVGDGAGRSPEPNAAGSTGRPGLPAPSAEAVPQSAGSGDPPQARGFPGAADG